MLFVKACLLASFITPFSAAADFGAFQPLDKLFLFGDSLTQKSANRTADNGFSLLGKLESRKPSPEVPCASTRKVVSLAD